MKFNFDNLPAARTRGGSENELVGTFAALVNAAPRALGIKEVMAVAEAAGLEIPSEATVRKYLNTAVADGRISKPTRQTYGVAGGESVADDEDEAEDAVEGIDADDALADL